MVTLVSGLVLAGLVLLGVLVWTIWSLHKHQEPFRRASRWKLVFIFAAVLAMVDLSDVMGKSRALRQQTSECRASFERDFTFDPSQPNVAPSYNWDTTKCPNARYPIKITARDAAGNVGETTGILSVLNLGRIPLLGFETQTLIHPGGGYVELVTADTKKRTFGLSDGTFRFSWSIVSQNNEAWVVENGVLRSIRPAPKGSILRLSVDIDANVTYLRNGVVFFTSSRKLLASSKVQVEVEDANTLLGLLTIAGGSK